MSWGPSESGSGLPPSQPQPIDQQQDLQPQEEEDLLQHQDHRKKKRYKYITWIIIFSSY